MGSTGTKEEFERDWYDAQPFGSQTSYGYHEGADINKRTGGDTDLNQELKAIASGKIYYYHFLSHPTSNYGRHLVYRIDGPWGVRFVHYAHMSDLDFMANTNFVSEGQILGRIGKSGTPVAHLHWAIYKEDPVGFGIDNIANNTDELNRLWEDPVKFVNTWMVAPIPVPVPDVRITLLDQAGILTEGDTRRAIDRDRTYPQLELEKAALQTQYDSLKSRIKTSVNNAIDSTN